MRYNIGSWVKKARLKANLSQEKLALALDVGGKGTVSAWEKNKNAPSFEIMIKISDLCAYPLPYIAPKQLSYEYPEMSTIHSRIKQARLAKGITQAELAEMLNLSTTAIQLWENEDESKATAPQRKRLETVANILDVSVMWLQLGDNPLFSEGGAGLAKDSNASNTHNKIMMYDLDITADKNNAKWVLIKSEEPLFIGNSWLKSKNLIPSELRALRVKGNSMSPHLEKDDIVIININDIEPIDDEIYAVVYNNRFFIRRIRITGDSIDLISLNSDYETIKVSNIKTDQLIILGKKVWRCG
ncbi:putative transcriptional regulator [Snodgrassella alvi SCGC AB-598-O02]|nr:putative transcriptional regulator [Snodgrassella alvi SCGC AB-598-O02]